MSKDIIIISKRDLNKHRKFIMNRSWNYYEVDDGCADVHAHNALDYLHNTYVRQGAVKINGIELYVCHPNRYVSLSSLICILKDMKIEYFRL